MNDEILLSSLQEGDAAVISQIPLSNNLYERFFDMGIIRGTDIKCVKRKKGIAAYSVRQTVIALRDADTNSIICRRNECDGI